MGGFFRKISVMLIVSACLTLFGQKSVKMSVSSTEMFKNDAFELEIRFENFESEITVEYPSFKDLIKISGPYQSSSTSIINGAVTKSLVLTYQFAPSRTGRITIG
ncbi:MAG: BatD family protein, partial [Candidatus Delongbacteria bacterium]